MFAQLATKTVYSFMDSLIDIPSYIERAKKLGYRQIGIMDKDNLYTAYHFIVKAQKAGLIPIVGLELDVFLEGQETSLYLLAQNTAGYRNLMKISTLKMTGYDSFSDFEEYLEGIQLIIPYSDSIDDISISLPYYIGVDLDTPQRNFSKKILPIHKVSYFQNEDTETLQMLHAIRDNLPLKDVPPVAKNQFLLPEKEISDLFKERFPESLTNLEEVLSDISYHFDTDLKLPRFNREKSAVDQLRELSEQGLREKQLFSLKYNQRLNEELAIIHKMGFDDYFLIVWDLLRFGRSRGYYMGMGRGSAAGSLVAYALDITGIDPVANNLLFERFLNEERYSMPDIDIDLPDIYRNEFLHYVRDRYGSTHSAQIVTFSTFGARQVIRDVFKRFGATEYELGNLTKKISFRDSLRSAYEKNIAFRQLINSKAEFQRAFEIAKRIEGKPRQTSIHAAGIVMSDDNLTDHIPLKSGEEMMITQYDASAVEANGLLKMDFLGLRNLTFVQKMQEKVAADYGESLDISSINLEDKETLALFAAGKTKGIFQFEAAGAINLLRRIKPSCFEEVVATTSLNRPGASDYTENFIRRKYGREKIDLIDESVASILEPTYGIMLYQEQVMQIAQVFAGFTLGKADLLRRAMSKKNADEMQKMKADFLVGAKQLGRDPNITQDLFSRMAKFAGYGFNRSHAYAYSALAFQMAYFKTHYPKVFFDVLLNYSSSAYLTDALEAEFKISPLSINTIPYFDKIEDNHIYLGLKNVKGLMKDFAYWIIENRPYTGIEDFMTRMPEKYQKADILKPLIQIGLFDLFDSNRQKIIINLEHLFTFVNELGSLFADSSYSWIEAEDYSNAEKYQLEQEIIGAGISPHPLVEIAKTSSENFTAIADIVKDSEVTLLGQIESIRVIRTKSKGEQMAFLSVTDTRKKIDITLFPESYQKYKKILAEKKIFFFTGKIQERDNRLQMILNFLKPASAEKFWIKMQNHDYDAEISAILAANPGDIPVVLHYADTKDTFQSTRYYVAKTPELERELETLAMKTVFQ
ncbi:DNA polymerase III subunit alpha [Streptococcus macacae]|uniref:DNA polymerase III subunit alpha n=1 Tax=Streptococcus macacae NCTC 11558 TaxID=764298 RepID=G5JUG4_9STRE|nr:DNA polymerase III subunit alpha [Streptococcus macacae]EHJ51735.1 DNA polymerase III, alpha subunit [Streptococcus macacae NCTC 11558]SUN78606.1 DNA polymerase III DnaE [Streptococcus macacae NCTC 11558]